MEKTFPLSSTNPPHPATLAIKLQNQNNKNTLKLCFFFEIFILFLFSTCFWENVRQTINKSKQKQIHILKIHSQFAVSQQLTVQTTRSIYFNKEKNISYNSLENNKKNFAGIIVIRKNQRHALFVMSHCLLNANFFICQC